MRVPIYQVDAFADRVFAGNPAAVCPLESWLETKVMQAIAAENNLSETAFFIANGDAYDIRWFTPKAEIDLAGHPTLATAHAIFTEIEPGRRSVRFNTKLGDVLTVVEDEGVLIMDFPARPPAPAEGIDEMAEALGARPELFLAARDAFAVFGSAATDRLGREPRSSILISGPRSPSTPRSRPRSSTRRGPRRRWLLRTTTSPWPGPLRCS